MVYLTHWRHLLQECPENPELGTAVVSVNFKLRQTNASEERWMRLAYTLNESPVRYASHNHPIFPHNTYKAVDYKYSESRKRMRTIKQKTKRRPIRIQVRLAKGLPSTWQTGTAPSSSMSGTRSGTRWPPTWIRRASFTSAKVQLLCMYFLHYVWHVLQGTIATIGNGEWWTSWHRSSTAASGWSCTRPSCTVMGSPDPPPCATRMRTWGTATMLTRSTTSSSSSMPRTSNIKFLMATLVLMIAVVVLVAHLTCNPLSKLSLTLTQSLLRVKAMVHNNSPRSRTRTWVT